MTAAATPLSLLPLGSQLVSGDGKDDNEANDNQLKVGGDPQQSQAIAKETDKKRTYERTCHRTLSARGGTATDDDGRNHIQLHG